MCGMQTGFVLIYESICYNAYNFRARRSWNNCVYVPNVGIKLLPNASCTTISLANENSVEKFGEFVITVTYRNSFLCEF